MNKKKALRLHLYLDFTFSHTKKRIGFAALSEKKKKNNLIF